MSISEVNIEVWLTGRPPLCRLTRIPFCQLVQGNVRPSHWLPSYLSYFYSICGGPLSTNHLHIVAIFAEARYFCCICYFSYIIFVIFLKILGPLFILVYINLLLTLKLIIIFVYQLFLCLCLITLFLLCFKSTLSVLLNLLFLLQHISIQ